MSGFNKHHFTESGTWTAPEGIDTIQVIGCGGGGGGEGGSQDNGCGGNGGGGATASTVILTVVPGESYDITIGEGGAKGDGGVYQTSNSSPGTQGGDTVFDELYRWYGAAGGNGGVDSAISIFAPTNQNFSVDVLVRSISSGGSGGPTPSNGSYSYNGNDVGGAAGDNTYGGAGGGGGCSNSNVPGVGVGGDSSASGDGIDGTSSAPNSGHGGGGGSSRYGVGTDGYPEPGITKGGNGGDGGSGFITIIW